MCCGYNRTGEYQFIVAPTSKRKKNNKLANGKFWQLSDMRTIKVRKLYIGFGNIPLTSHIRDLGSLSTTYYNVTPN